MNLHPRAEAELVRAEMKQGSPMKELPSFKAEEATAREAHGRVHLHGDHSSMKYSSAKRKLCTNVLPQAKMTPSSVIYFEAIR